MIEILLAGIFKKLDKPGLEINPEVFEKLVPADGAASDYFGWSVAVSPDGLTVVVGAYGDDDKGSNSGSAYVFTKQANGSYLETHKLLALDGAAGSYFGFSVAASNTSVVVGAYNHLGTGSAYIFTKEPDGSYFETQKLVAADGTSGVEFGYGVAVSGDGSTVVVGADRAFDKGRNSGAAYVFTKQADGSYLQTQKLLASVGASLDWFGMSVAVSGDGLTVVVGAHGDDGKGHDAGSAYIFTKQTDGSYLQSQKLVATDGAARAYFGISVAISTDGSTVIAGGYGDDDKGALSGSAYIFTKQANGSYLETQKLVASDGAANDYFGYSVAVSRDGSTVVVGAYLDDDKGTDSGSVYIFNKQANGSYLQTQKLVATDGAARAYFGYSVAASNTSVAVGAYNHLGTGAVYFY